ncbi:MAG: hypothetical protein WDW38_001352 [Sanguina aurantia]
MSEDYEEDFEQYSEEGFEGEEEDYEVLPSRMAQSTAVNESSVQPSPKGSARASYSGTIRPQSQGRGTGTPGAGYGTSRGLALPQFTGLTDSQRQSAAKKLAAATKRMKEVNLQVVAIDDLFVMAPLSKYDLYFMGRSVYSSVKVAASQTNEDAKEEECQTDDISVREYSCQVPDDRNTSSPEDKDAAPSGRAGNGAGPSQRIAHRMTRLEAGIETKLSAFLQWAGPMMLTAIGLAPSNKTVAIKAVANSKDLSGGMVRLSFDALLANRPVSCSSYSTGAEPMLLVSYSVVNAQMGSEALLSDHSLGAKGCMCVWDLSNPTVPHAVLVSEGSPAVCCWGPAPATNLVFAGMEEGGICVWDLEETASRHPTESVGGSLVVLRRPSYTTEGSSEVITSAAPIVAMCPLATSSGRSTPCQLVTLSCWGDVNVYTVSVMARGDTAAADADLGVRVGSRVRLLKTSSSIQIGMQALHGGVARPREASALLRQTYALQLLTHHSRQFLVGADGGKVLRGSWVGAPPAPKEYIADDHMSEAASSSSASAIPSSATTLHASPFYPSAFLAGHDDGTVVLHRADQAAAVLVWFGVAAARVQVVRWSPSRPCAFFVLDAFSTLYCFDLSVSRTGPVHTQVLVRQEADLPAPVLSTYFEAGMLRSTTALEGQPSFAVGYDSGEVDCHILGARFGASQTTAELQVLEDLVGAANQTTKT